MNLSPDELSKMNSYLQKQRVLDGTHHLLKRPDGSSLASDRVKAGTHHLLSGDIQRASNKRRIEEKTHNFLGSDFASKRNATLLKNGGHTSQRKICCLKCHAEVTINTFTQHTASSKCKAKSNDKYEYVFNPGLSIPTTDSSAIVRFKRSIFHSKV